MCLIQVSEENTTIQHKDSEERLWLAEIMCSPIYKTAPGKVMVRLGPTKVWKKGELQQNVLEVSL